MNSLAQQALDRAMGRPLPVPTGKPEASAAEPVPDLVITGPINKVMQLEGKRYALDFVRALGASVRRAPIREKAIADLTRYAAVQPSSVASGVKIVIDVLKGAA
ncbi:hypothetical protein [Pseudomonas fluorescens]|uniref:hypothetical protein n=1 Tax=Pseudomonas fluorescens TaxID=294 RepID=UPI000AD2A866|nr:hypothetical protein [Pseudomonas fluorescens]